MLKFLFKRPEETPAPVSAPVAPPATAPVVAPAAPRPVQPTAHPIPAVAKTVPAAATAYRSDHKSLYKQLLGGLYDAILITDPKGHIIDCNPRVADFFQFDKNEVWDMGIEKLIPGITPQLLARVQQGVAAERHVMIGARAVRKDLTSFPAEVAISAISLINEGDLVFAVRNVEKRKQQMALLRGAQGALANDLAAVAIADSGGRIVYANPALRQAWACSRDEDVIGQPLAGLWAADPQGGEPLRQAASGHRWTGTVQATARDGRGFQAAAACSAQRVGEADGGYVCSFIELANG